MKAKNYDYQSIKPFEKAKPNAKFKPQLCFKYYIKQTGGNKVYSLEKTFKYIDDFYEKYEKNNKMNAHEKYTNQNFLINKLSYLDYQNQISFSVVYPIFSSIVISLYFASLQIPNENGYNFFEVINNGFNEYKTAMEQYPSIAATIADIICGVILFAIVLLILSIPAANLIVFVKERYDFTKYNNKFLLPYERKVVQETLSSYDKDYDFLK